MKLGDDAFDLNSNRTSIQYHWESRVSYRRRVPNFAGDKQATIASLEFLFVTIQLHCHNTFLGHKLSEDIQHLQLAELR
jgi:hypothetical protein